MNKDKMRKGFESFVESTITRASARLQQVMEVELMRLQNIYPKRRLLFQDIMGSVTISVEMFHTIPNTTLEHDGGIWMAVNWAPGLAYGGMLDEHMELLDWYNEWSDRFKVCIDRIIVGPARFE